MYLTVTGLTLDPGQDGLDLREWTEKKWVMYVDMLPEMSARTALVMKDHVGEDPTNQFLPFSYWLA